MTRVPTRYWRRMHGIEGGETGVDDTFAQQSFDNVGARILGRNMFGRGRARHARLPRQARVTPHGARSR